MANPLTNPVDRNALLCSNSHRYSEPPRRRCYEDFYSDAAACAITEEDCSSANFGGH